MDLIKLLFKIAMELVWKCFHDYESKYLNIHLTVL